MTSLQKSAADKAAAENRDVTLQGRGGEVAAGRPIHSGTGQTTTGEPHSHIIKTSNLTIPYDACYVTLSSCMQPCLNF